MPKQIYGQGLLPFCMNKNMYMAGPEYTFEFLY